MRELDARLSASTTPRRARRNVSAASVRAPPPGRGDLSRDEFLRGQDFDHYLSDIEAQGMRSRSGLSSRYLRPIVSTLEVAHDRGHHPSRSETREHLHPGARHFRWRSPARTSACRGPKRRPITRDGMIIGSPELHRPEVWEGQPAGLDLRVDVYSLGAIIFRALAGRVPFPTTSVREKAEAAKTAERPSLHAIRPDLPKAVDQMGARGSGRRQGRTIFPGAIHVDRAPGDSHLKPEGASQWPRSKGRRELGGRSPRRQKRKLRGEPQEAKACKGDQERRNPGRGLREGDSVPSFSSSISAGNACLVRFARRKPFVPYFYPKDDTPGCTREACAFRDDHGSSGRRASPSSA